MSGPLFTVVIPTFHRNDLLARCLERLAPGVQQMKDYEVIVTDDGRETTAREMLADRFPWAVWTAAPGRGPAANRNNGAKLARGEWLVFTDDDCIPDAGWLTGFQAAEAENPGCRVFEGQIYADRPKRSLDEIAPVNDTGGYLWSCNFAIARNLFEEMGGFDERFQTAMEDVDLNHRLKKAGHRALFVPSAKVCHPWRARGRGRDGWKHAGNYSNDTLRYLEIHPEERANLSAGHFLRGTLRAFCKETLPGVFKFRGRGIRGALFFHAEALRLAFRLLRC